MHATINEEAINILTGTATDLYTCTPAYKQTMVKMRVLREKGNRPLPSSNPRDKKRNPQNGVEIEQNGKENNTYHSWTRGGDSGERDYFN